MASCMKTLLLNPPSFEKFDGGAGSRWPATREIESYWYPVWLSYPAGMLPGSRLLDAPPNHITPLQVMDISKDYEFVILFTSTVGFYSDLKMARGMKERKPSIKICFVGPQVQIKPSESLLASEDIDFVVRGEFDFAVVDYANGKPLSEIPNVSWRNGTEIVHNPSRPMLQTAELDSLPFATDVYQRDLTVENYNVPFLLHPFVSFYTARGCPALCTFCLWPQTLSGHAWRTRSVESVAREFKQAHKMFPQAKEFFFDDDTFNIRKDRVMALCKEFKSEGFRWSCTARSHSDLETLGAMADAGCRLLIVGFESGDPQILKNIKKGNTVEMGRTFVQNCKKVGIHVHGDFIIGLPGETKETIEKTINYAKELDCETIQVSMAHAYPGTALYDQGMKEGFLAGEAITDDLGHQLPHLQYPNLSREYMVESVNRFYDEYYFRPRVAWRIVREALWDSHERKRLFHEAWDFMKLRHDRIKVAKKGVQQKAMVQVKVPAISQGAGESQGA
jgi:hopanoid biosynthesis associated radical SAM protein HpnJ